MKARGTNSINFHGKICSFPKCNQVLVSPDLQSGRWADIHAVGLWLSRVCFPSLSYINLLSLFFHETVIPSFFILSKNPFHLSSITHIAIIPVSHLFPKSLFDFFSPIYSVLVGRLVGCGIGGLEVVELMSL